jgi:hypothetical protein
MPKRIKMKRTLTAEAAVAQNVNRPKRASPTQTAPV